MQIYLHTMQIINIIYYAYVCTGCLHYSNGPMAYAMNGYFLPQYVWSAQVIDIHSPSKSIYKHIKQNKIHV